MTKKVIKADSAESADQGEGNSEATCGSNSRSTQLIVREIASELAPDRGPPKLQEPDALTLALQLAETQGISLYAGEDLRQQMHLDPIAYYASIGPSDALESAIARVTVGVMNGAMDCFGRASRNDASPKAQQAYLGLGIKASLAVAELVEAFDKHRGRDRPKVAVAQVNVQSGGQAIVGNVERQERSNGEGEPTRLFPAPDKLTDERKD